MANDGNNKVWVVMPAAGVGKRMESNVPKQYLKIHNKTILEHTINCFISNPSVAGIVLALAGDDPYWKYLKLPESEDNAPVYTVEGGSDRSESVMQTLDYLSMVERLDESTWVMVHDAARPCLSRKDIKTLLMNRGKDCDGAILATPVRDTMKRSKNDSSLISHTENRDNLWHALTPQMFKLGQLRDALIKCQDSNIDVTDDSSAMEVQGYNVKMIEGESTNIKVTRPADLHLASLLLDVQGEGL